MIKILGFKKHFHNNMHFKEINCQNRYYLSFVVISTLLKEHEIKTSIKRKNENTLIKELSKRE